MENLDPGLVLMLLFYISCRAYKNNGESVDDLLFHCLVTRDTGSFVFALFGASSIIPKTVTRRTPVSEVLIWKVIPCVLCGQSGVTIILEYLKGLSILIMSSKNLC